MIDFNKWKHGETLLPDKSNRPTSEEIKEAARVCGVGTDAIWRRMHGKISIRIALSAVKNNTERPYDRGVSRKKIQKAAEELGCPEEVVVRRLRHYPQWTVERCLTQPIRIRDNKKRFIEVKGKIQSDFLQFPIKGYVINDL